MFIFTKIWQLIKIKKEEREKYQLFYKLLKRFFYTYCVIAVVIVVTSLYLKIDVVKDGDFQNWTSFVLELGLGAYMATAILTYENVQKKRNEKQQQDIADLVVGIKKIEENQEVILNQQLRIRNEKREFAEERCRFYLDYIKKNILEIKSIVKNPDFITTGNFFKDMILHLSKNLQEFRHEFSVDLSPGIISLIDIITSEIEDMNIELFLKDLDIYDDILEHIENIHEEMIVNQKNSLVKSNEPI